MLHNETRALILKAWDKTHNAEEIAECFSADRSTVYRLVKRRDETGEWQTRTNLRGRKPALSDEQKQGIIRLVEEQPDITINEIVERLQLAVCGETVRRVLHKAGYTYKKKSMHAKEQERPRCPGVPIFLYCLPYSQALNPIEKLWSKLKSVLRKLKVRAVNKLPQAIAEAFHAISQQDCRAWFRLGGVALIK